VANERHQQHDNNEFNHKLVYLCVERHIVIDRDSVDIWYAMIEHPIGTDLSGKIKRIFPFWCSRIVVGCNVGCPIGYPDPDIPLCFIALIEVVVIVKETSK
jgi:hypothetical protein